MELIGLCITITCSPHVNTIHALLLQYKLTVAFILGFFQNDGSDMIDDVLANIPDHLF